MYDDKMQYNGNICPELYKPYQSILYTYILYNKPHVKKTS